MMVTVHRLFQVAHVLVDAALGDERLQILKVVARLPEILNGFIDSRVAGAGDVVLVHCHRKQHGMIGAFLVAELPRIHLLQQGQGVPFVLMIDHRVDAGEFLHGGSVVTAACRQEENGGCKRNDDVPEMYHLIAVFVSSSKAIHLKKR